MAWAMAALLLTQLWVAGYQSMAALTGIEVCSAEGMLRVSADGQPITAAPHHGHDCCLPLGTANLLPSPPLFGLLALAGAAPEPLLSAARLDAEALTPLSRGPPLHS